MPNPLSAFLLLFAIFCLFLATSFMLNILYHYKVDNNPNQPEKEDKNANQSKIYYIERIKRPKTRKTKKPSIALKGTILTPEQFKKIEDKNFND